MSLRPCPCGCGRLLPPGLLGGGGYVAGPYQVFCLAADTKPEPVAAPIIGYRAWRVVGTSERPRLAGVGHMTEWSLPMPYKAECIPAEPFFSKPPHRDGLCGIWAMKDPVEAHTALASYAIFTSDGLLFDDDVWMAIGRVELWGRIFEHRLGWRAEFARPLEISAVRCASLDLQRLVVRADGGSPTTARALSAELASLYGAQVGPRVEWFVEDGGAEYSITSRNLRLSIAVVKPQTAPANRLLSRVQVDRDHREPREVRVRGAAQLALGFAVGSWIIASAFWAARWLV